MSFPNLSAVLVPFAVTWCEFVFKRPKWFFAERDRDPTKYLNPYVFAVGNVFLTGLTFVVPKVMRREQFDASDVLTGIVATAAMILVQYIATVVGSLAAAKLLREHVEWGEITVAFCYASALLPLVTLMAGPAFEKLSADVTPLAWALLLIAGAEILFAAFIIAAVARINVLQGKRFVRFASAAAALILTARGIAGYPVMLGIAALERQNADPRAAVHAAAASQDITLPCQKPTAITGGARNITMYSAELTGSADPSATRTWFDFDASPKLAYSVEALRHAGLAGYLKPNTTYHYRYAAQNDCGTVRGETLTFTTRAAP